MNPILTIHRHLGVEFLFPIFGRVKDIDRAYSLLRDDPRAQPLAAQLEPMWLERNESYSNHDPEAERQSVSSEVWQLAFARSAVFRAAPCTR